MIQACYRKAIGYVRGWEVGCLSGIRLAFRGASTAVAFQPTRGAALSIDAVYRLRVAS